MALTYPLSLASFQDKLSMAEITFTLPVRGATMSLGGGEDIGATFGPSLWRGTIRLSPEYHDASEGNAALLRRLHRAGATFLLSPAHMRRNGAATGQLLSSSAANLIAIGGVATGRVFKAGEFFGLSRGNPAKYFLHQFLEDATADALGNTPEVEIEPPLEPGWSIGETVTFARPVCKAKLVTGALGEPSIRPVISSGTTFEWVQTFR